MHQVSNTCTERSHLAVSGYLTHTCDAWLTRRLLASACGRRSSGGASAAMSHPKHPGEVSSLAPTVSSRAMHTLWCALSPAVCLMCFGGGEKGCCTECHSTFEKDKPSRTKCWRCRTPSKPEHTPTLDPLAQIGQNACQLMNALPVHSHHRAPLLSALSQHIPSSTAATLLHAASSTIRKEEGSQ